MPAAGGPLDVARLIESTMGATARAVQDATRAVMAEAANVARDELKATAPLVPGNDREFSRGRRMGKLTTRIRIDKGNVLVSPRGPWGIAESGASPHAPNHPGTVAKQGRQSWTIGRDNTFRRLIDRVPDRYAAAAEEGFRR